MDENKQKKQETRSDAWYMITEIGKQNNKRMFIAMMTTLFLWFSTICGFVWYLSLYDYSVQTYDFDTQDGGAANYIGNDGDIYNGTAHSN